MTAVLPFGTRSILAGWKKVGGTFAAPVSRFVQPEDGRLDKRRRPCPFQFLAASVTVNTNSFSSMTGKGCSLPEW
jgi:hypothetical protein